MWHRKFVEKNSYLVYILQCLLYQLYCMLVLWKNNNKQYILLIVPFLNSPTLFLLRFTQKIFALEIFFHSSFFFYYIMYDCYIVVSCVPFSTNRFGFSSSSSLNILDCILLFIFNMSRRRTFRLLYLYYYCDVVYFSFIEYTFFTLYLAFLIFHLYVIVVVVIIVALFFFCDINYSIFSLRYSLFIQYVIFFLFSLNYWGGNAKRKKNDARLMLL